MYATNSALEAKVKSVMEIIPDFDENAVRTALEKNGFDVEITINSLLGGI